MSNEYKYYKENGKLMRLHIEQDNEPLNPRYDWDGNIGKVIEFGNVNAYINHEVVPPFLKSDTVISTIDYHRRLDGNKYSDYSGNIQL